MATLSVLRTRARQRCDHEDSAYIADAELTNYINSSYAELYDLLVARYEDYFVTGPTTFSLASGDGGVYALPSAFYKLRGVDYSYGGDWIPLKPFAWNTRGSRSRASIRDFDRTYRIVGSNLRVEPSDNATGDYRLWYVPSYTALSADGDAISTLISRNNWEEYIVIDAAIKILNKEESNSDRLMQEKQLIKERILNVSSDRDAEGSASITDSRSDFWGDY
jgi:hypothetical protein